MQTLEQLRSGQLQGTRHFKLSSNLTAFPLEILDLAESLEILDLSGNRISTLPAEITRLKHLKILFLSDNAFTEFPAELAQCGRLDIIGFKANHMERIDERALPQGIRWLILTNNRLTKLPSSIGTCVRLQKLMLAGNRLTELPESMIHCKNLELLRIAANRFEKLPSWLFELPRLSWLALAGNPITRSAVFENTLPEIAWNEFEIRQLLGEGASGIISRAYWRNEETGQEVAVKVFKGEVTSDGLPSDEMNACIAAGSHVNLIKVRGRISAHPRKSKAWCLT